MRNRHSYLAAPTVLAFTLASLSQGAIVQVRDAVGGEDTDGTPNGYYKSTLGSRPQGTVIGGTYGNLNTGAFDLEADFGSGFIPLTTYCIEPTQGVGFGLNPPDNVGAQFTTSTLIAGGFTLFETNFLQKLWFGAFADSLTSKAKSAAFQSIIWELVQDNSINFSTGMFKLNAADPYTDSVRTIAQGWVNNINGGTWTSMTQLGTLTIPGFQDFVTAQVPGPGGAFVLFMGGCLALGRRRR